ncbi:MAG: hypothetical protein DRZ76_02325 [Candidatus Nealsonbacteria bacterium]|nr:MAG: hypothetical protein DRZ76_02325 [Candidatus Nealsonbacteria bacterium]
MDYPSFRSVPVEEKPKSKKLMILGLVIIIAIVAGGFYFWQKMTEERKVEYSQVYRLVNEKISQSAAIVIHLPAVVSEMYFSENFG